MRRAPKRWTVLTTGVLFCLAVLFSAPHTVHHLEETTAHCPLLAWGQQAGVDLPPLVSVLHRISLLLTASVEPAGSISLIRYHGPSPRSPPIFDPRIVVHYSFFDDQDGRRTGIEQTLHSLTIAPTLHLTNLLSHLRFVSTVPRSNHPIHWVDLRLEYRLDISDEDVFVNGDDLDDHGQRFTVQVVANF